MTALKKPTKTILKRKQLRKEKRQSKKTSKMDFYKKRFVSKRAHNDDEEIVSDDDEVAVKAKEMKAAEEAEAKQRKAEKKAKEEKRQADKQRRKQLKVIRHFVDTVDKCFCFFFHASKLQYV